MIWREIPAIRDRWLDFVGFERSQQTFDHVVGHFALDKKTPTWDFHVLISAFW
jgi:hypothetical protein